MLDSVATILALSLGLGMLHALDADHLLTVTGISANENQWKKLFRYCFHWALGHSASLILIGFSIFLLGLSFNSLFSQYAELSVAVILAVIGVQVLVESFQSLLGIKRKANKENSISSARALVVGSIHGVAGTASVLALIPMAKISEPVVAIGYLIIFSLGVILSMFIFGGVFRHTATHLFLRYPQSIIMVKIVIGILALFFAFKLTFSVI